MTNKKYIEQAKEAIERIFSNTDQSKEQTKIDLEEVQEEVEARLEALKDN